RKSAAVIAAAMLAGCTVGPDYARPTMELPGAWSPAPETVTAAGAAEVSTVRADWWTSFGDPVLSRMVEQALAANDDIMLAAARVSEARAILRFTEADRLPQLDAEASAARVR